MPSNHQMKAVLVENTEILRSVIAYAGNHGPAPEFTGLSAVAAQVLKTPAGRAACEELAKEIQSPLIGMVNSYRNADGKYPPEKVKHDVNWTSTMISALVGRLMWMAENP